MFITLTQHISEAYQWSNMIELVCLDTEKAVDVVLRQGLIGTLSKMAIQNLIFFGITHSSLKETFTLK